MQQNQLEQFKAWFSGYAAGFYTDDAYVNTNLKLKQDHSIRVCEEMAYLTGSLALGENQHLIAQTTSLFHDLGRFEQFTKYRTYTDHRSVNHCTIALDVLRENNILDELDQRERQIIETAIELHGLKELPENLNNDTALFAKLIRDADKIDIYRVVIENYEKYSSEPEKSLFEIEFPDEPYYSPQMIDAVLNGQRVDYSALQTLNDMMLLQLTWVYDVNFHPALLRIKQRRILEQIITFLPQDPQIAAVAKTILKYLGRRIKQKN